MSEHGALEEQSVQATMLMALYGRAVAGRRFPDILRDTVAERIVDEADFDFGSIAAVHGTEYASLACLIRAARMDECARRFIGAHPDGVIVSLGAGLDDSFSRVDNGRIRWYNLDVPDAIAYRERFIEPTERCRNIARSMLDPSWFELVETPPDGSVLVLAAGLFFYFDEAQIRELAVGICERFPHGELFFDACSRSGAKIANRMVRKTGNSGAKMGFWVDNASKLRAWSPRIQQAMSYPFFGERCKDRRFAGLTRFMMWGADFLNRTKFVNITW